MSPEANRFRNRAKQCRVLAQDARDRESRDTLTGMAEELDSEATRIDHEEAARPKDL